MAGGGTHGKVLLVEDDEATRANLADVLELEGFEAVGCGTWDEALRLAGSDGPFAAVIADRRLSDGTADERMGELERALPEVPKIVVTGYDDLEGAVAAMRQGADDYLLKPVDPDLLLRSVRRLVELRETRRRLRALERESQERRRLADIGAITARVVHDIGNPVAGIGTLSQMLVREVEEKGDLERACEFAREIRDAAARLERMIREFREFARGREPERRPTNVAGLLEEIVRFYRPLAAEQGSVLELGESAPAAVVLGDATQLRRVLENLVLNAIEALAETGGGRIVVESRLREESVRISVRDDGPGIPDSFDPYRLFATTKEKGTGLGLAICRQIVEQHHGRLLHEKAVPRGTVFHVDLPVVSEEAQARA